MSEMNANCETVQREQCARTLDLLGTCVCCSNTFEKRQRNQVTCGKPHCRKSRQQYAMREREHLTNDSIRWERRRAKSTVDNIAQTRGPQGRDNYKQQQGVVTDDKQTHSRCLQCGADFVDGEGKLVTSSFEFCDETLLRSGACKQAWIAAHPITLNTNKAKFTQVTPEDVDWGRKQGRTEQRMPRRKLNFCPQCSDYVNQDHEHPL